MSAPLAAIPLRAGLVALAARRVLRPGWLLLVAAVLVLAATHDWGFAESVVADASTAVLARGRARQGTWAVALLVLAPALLHRGGRAAAEWRRSEADWLAPRPLPRAAWLLSTALGTFAAGALLLSAAAAAAELRAGRGERAWRWARALEHPSFALVEGDAARSWVEPGLAREGAGARGAAPDGARLLVRPTVAPGSGPAATVRVTAAPELSAGPAVEARIDGRARIALDLPAGAGPLTLTVERVGPGAVVVLPAGAVELVLPARSERLASLELLARVALGLAVVVALGLGLGAWMRPALATGTLLALAALPAISPAAARLLPAGDLSRAWRLVGEGLVPPPIAPAPLLVGLALVAGGLLLAERGLARGKGALQP